MKNKKNLTPIFSLASVFILGLLSFERSRGETLEKEQIERTLKLDHASEETMYFVFQNETLDEIVDKIAQAKQLKVMRPAQSTPGLKDIRVTWGLRRKVTIKQAWEHVITLLKISGYSVISKKGQIVIVPTPNVNQEAAPVFVNTPGDLLPDSDQTIRYLYYFENITLADQNSNAKNNITQLLNDILPINQSQNFLVDDVFNSLLITSGARNIKDALQILRHFDRLGSQESIEVLPLFYTDANSAVQTVNQLIPGASQDNAAPRFPGGAANKQQRYSYFSDQVRVVPISRTNSIAIFGPVDAVAKTRDFLQKYIDREVDAERVTVHIKHINFLDAQAFKAVLDQLVSAQQANDQSTGQNQASGIFNPTPVISAEVPRSAQQDQNDQSGQQQGLDQNISAAVGVQLDNVQNTGAIIGGNNLIIGAKESDWKILERIIDECDTLQQQVAIEALILNVSMSSLSNLGVQGRGFNLVGSPSDFKIQSSMLGQPYLNSTSTTATTPIDNNRGIDANFMGPSTVGTNSDGSGTPYQNFILQNPSQFTAPGAMVATFGNSEGVYAILNTLMSAQDTIVVSQPYVITKNNKGSYVYVSTSQRVPGSINPQVTGGQVVRNVQSIEAAIVLYVLPRISTDGQSINLEVNIRINDFDQTETQFYTIAMRTLMSNINLKNGELTALGGLSRYTTQKAMNEWPIVAKIPIVGSIFKNRQNLIAEERAIVAFLRPTIIHPQLGGGAGDYTVDKYLSTKDAVNLRANLFDNMRDPVTKYMFKPEQDEKIIDRIEGYMDAGAYGSTVSDNLNSQLNAPLSEDAQNQIMNALQDTAVSTAKPQTNTKDLRAITEALEKLEEHAEAQGA